MSRCGTSGHGLAVVVVLGGWWDLMILEVFSNLKDSMVLRFYDSRLVSSSLTSFIF